LFLVFELSPVPNESITLISFYHAALNLGREARIIELDREISIPGLACGGPSCTNVGLAREYPEVWA
jgi:hypothetical protein